MKGAASVTSRDFGSCACGGLSCAHGIAGAGVSSFLSVVCICSVGGFIDAVEFFEAPLWAGSIVDCDAGTCGAGAGTEVCVADCFVAGCSTLGRGGGCDDVVWVAD